MSGGVGWVGAASGRCAADMFSRMWSNPIRVVCVGIVALAVGSMVGCADGDEPDEQITRIDGPAVVDADRDGQLDG
jgi:hypothetical protein